MRQVLCYSNAFVQADHEIFDTSYLALPDAIWCLSRSLFLARCRDVPAELGRYSGAESKLETCKRVQRLVWPSTWLAEDRSGGDAEKNSGSTCEICLVSKMKEPKLEPGSGRRRIFPSASGLIIILISTLVVLDQQVTCRAGGGSGRVASHHDVGAIKADQHSSGKREDGFGSEISPVGRAEDREEVSSLFASSLATTKTTASNQDEQSRDFATDAAGRGSQFYGGGVSNDSTIGANVAPLEARDLPRYSIDRSTKVIHVDQSNESGILWGTLNGDPDAESPPVGQSRARPVVDVPDGAMNNVRSRFNGDDDENSAANYSLFLISSYKEHFAILIDIESVDFEPIINCEYQEIRFSIVGEISKQLLERKNNVNASIESADSQLASDGDEISAGGAQTEPADDSNESSGEEEDAAESSVAADYLSQPPLPVSEAMALLMNAPLNKTILDESNETNEFRLIDTTIDYLAGETCRELKLRRRSGAGRSQTETVRQSQSKPKLSGRSMRKHRSRSKRRRGKHSQPDRCDLNEPEYKDLLATKLNNHLEWDDFKFVCGKTRQLIIPMRSLKLSISSDEFSPRSSFSIRYRFVSDPKELPAVDNGKYYCRNRQVIDLSLKCDGYDDCGDASDESVKICGYPTGRAPSKRDPASRSTNSNLNRKRLNSTLRQTDGESPLRLAGHDATKPDYNSPPRRKLTYFSGELVSCCQPSDWLNELGQSQPAGQTLNLQTLIGESMKLFSGPMFAPTKSSTPIERAQVKRVKRIVGGSEAPRGSWPGQVSLQYEILEPMCHFCAGTLIHPQYVLTAGHCITKEGLARGIKVVLGGHDLRQLNGSHIQERYVDDAQVYPGVNVKHSSTEWENDMNNDIALLRLNAPVSITQSIAPSCLPPYNTPLAINTTCHSIGWGQTHGSGSSNLLKHLPLRVVASAECSSKLMDRDNDNYNPDDDSGQRPPRARKSNLSISRSRQSSSSLRPVSPFETSGLDTYNNQTMVCVNNDHGHGICQGDSGGPLYCERITASGEQCKEIYGVASFIIQYATVGAMCAVENLPGIFSEVSSKTEWISSTIKMFEQSYRLKYSQNK